MNARSSFVAAAVVVTSVMLSAAVSHAARPSETTARVPPAPLLAAPGSAADAPAPNPEAGVYKIGPEDVLYVSVWKNAELTREVSVRPDGRISLPLLNDVQAANLTPMQLRDTVAKGLATYISEPEVSIIVKEIHSAKISVVGSVKNPNRYELRSQATVLEAMAMAGGLTDFAKRDRIVIYRRDGSTWKTLEFNYTKVVNDWDVQQNFVLVPGDIVVVP